MDRPIMNKTIDEMTSKELHAAMRHYKWIRAKALREWNFLVDGRKYYGYAKAQKVEAWREFREGLLDAYLRGDITDAEYKAYAAPPKGVHRNATYVDYDWRFADLARDIEESDKAVEQIKKRLEQLKKKRERNKRSEKKMAATKKPEPKKRYDPRKGAWNPEAKQKRSEERKGIRYS